jgi:acid stress-induced BolA-like protein IbaG/YrbA
MASAVEAKAGTFPCTGAVFRFDAPITEPGSLACGARIPYPRPMSSHPTDFQGSVIEALRESIEKAIPESKAHVTGSGGHFSIDVVSSAFTGKTMLASQRLVYSAIAHLMSGDMAPVHAVDSLTTRVPGA